MTGPARVPIPKRMAHLDRDHRGYPIPVTVWRDTTGKAHFTINDEVRRFQHLVDELCPICGDKLLRLRWFIGGPLSAFHEHGAYMDPPVHRECMTYALRVCPWLAAPVYARRIDTGTLRDPELSTMTFVDPTQIPNRPDPFVCVAATGQTISSSGDPVQPIYIKPKRPYAAIQFWRGGRQIDVPALRRRRTG